MLNCIEKSKSFVKKKLLIVGVVGVLCFVGCGTDKNVEVEAEKIVEAVENKDMETVEAMILGTSELAVDEELAEFFTNSNSENNGIISKIIEQDTIKVKKVVVATLNLTTCLMLAQQRYLKTEKKLESLTIA